MAEFIVALTGEFDMSNARRIGDRVVEVLKDRSSSRIVLDLSGVGFLDCAGIRSILYAQRLASSAGRKLTIRHPPALVAESIAILGLADQLYECRVSAGVRAKKSPGRNE